MSGSVSRKPDGIDDLALDPDSVGLPDNRFDHKTEQSEAVV